MSYYVAPNPYLAPASSCEARGPRSSRDGFMPHTLSCHLHPFCTVFSYSLVSPTAFLNTPDQSRSSLSQLLARIPLASAVDTPPASSAILFQFQKVQAAKRHIDQLV